MYNNHDAYTLQLKETVEKQKYKKLRNDKSIYILAT